MKTGSQKGKHFPAEIRQNFPLPDRNRNRKMEPNIRTLPFSEAKQGYSAEKATLPSKLQCLKQR